MKKKGLSTVGYKGFMVLSIVLLVMGAAFCIMQASVNIPGVNPRHLKIYAYDLWFFMVTGVIGTIPFCILMLKKMRLRGYAKAMVIMWFAAAGLLPIMLLAIIVSHVPEIIAPAIVAIYLVMLAAALTCCTFEYFRVKKINRLGEEVYADMVWEKRQTALKKGYSLGALIVFLSSCAVVCIFAIKVVDYFYRTSSALFMTPSPDDISMIGITVGLAGSVIAAVRLIFKTRIRLYAKLITALNVAMLMIFHVRLLLLKMGMLINKTTTTATSTLGIMVCALQLAAGVCCLIETVRLKKLYAANEGENAASLPPGLTAIIKKGFDLPMFIGFVAGSAGFCLCSLITNGYYEKIIKPEDGLLLALLFLLLFLIGSPVCGIMYLLKTRVRLYAKLIICADIMLLILTVPYMLGTITGLTGALSFDAWATKGTIVLSVFQLAACVCAITEAVWYKKLRMGRLQVKKLPEPCRIYEAGYMMYCVLAAVFILLMVDELIALYNGSGLIIGMHTVRLINAFDAVAIIIAMAYTSIIMSVMMMKNDRISPVTRALVILWIVLASLFFAVIFMITYGVADKLLIPIVVMYTLVPVAVIVLYGKDLYKVKKPKTQLIIEE